MRTIGIDLSVTGEHTALIVDEQGEPASALLRFASDPVALLQLLERAQRDHPDGCLQAVMEPTGMAWLPVSVFLDRQGVQVYLVNSQQVADLRRYFKKHAKSDRIDARVLAKLPLIDHEKLHLLELPGAMALACQRGCKQLDRLEKEITASKNRLIAMDRFAWPGLTAEVFPKTFSTPALWFREHWYSPYRVAAAGAEAVRCAWQESGQDRDDPGEWTTALCELAQRVTELYGAEGEYLDYGLLQAEVVREQKLIEYLKSQHHHLKHKVVRPLYRDLHPSRSLETIPGVGPDGACVFASFIGNPDRFGSLREHRGWSGMVPNSKQSADSEASGLKITQAGPRLIKKFSFLDAETARRRDPQIAALYYDQMMRKGKHHLQAVCACATHLLDRVLVVLRQNRPYELRDVDGTPVSQQRAMEIIQERYQVPEEVRRRTNKRLRRERAERQAQKKEEGKLRKSYGVTETPQASPLRGKH